jgi:2-polyprenyl-3-methyl-5-hydroxy-6-metoxy-1,4-benzoquinol methylase
MTHTDDIPTPRPLGELVYASFKIYALVAGLKLGVWASVAAGHHTAEAVAKAIGCDAVGIRRLLDALCAMGLLGKQDGRYGLVPIAELYLVPGGASYRGESLLHELAWEGHGQLADAILSGRRPLAADWASGEAERTWAGLASPRLAMPQRSLDIVDEIWESMGIVPREGLRILDVACGSAVWSLGLARHDPTIRVTLNELPDVLEVALQVANELGVRDQVTALPGSLAAVDFGREQYDLVVMGHILHFFSAGEVLALLHRAYAALAPGGVIAINEAIPDEERSALEYPLLAGLWLYASCAEGNVFTCSELQGLLAQAGFGGAAIVGEGDAYVRAYKS